MTFTSIVKTSSLVLTENVSPNPTVALDIPAGLCRIDIDFEPGTTGMITPMTGDSPTALKFHMEGGEIFTAVNQSKAFMLYGPTKLACQVEDLDGTVTVMCKVCMR